jgi:hypothetical protein
VDVKRQEEESRVDANTGIDASRLTLGTGGDFLS